MRRSKILLFITPFLLLAVVGFIPVIQSQRFAHLVADELLVLGGGAESRSAVYINVPTGIATTTPALIVNSAGVSNLIEARKNGTPVFAVDSAGDLTYSGTPVVNGMAYVNQPTAAASATPALFVNSSAAGANLFEVRKAATEVFAIHNGGDVDITGGLPAAAGSGDVLDLTSTSVILNGSDVIEMLDINLTGANNTGTGNDLTGINLSMTTADAQGRERGIVVNDTDWEMAIDAGPVPIVSSSQRWMEDGFGDTIEAEIVLLSGSDDVAVDPAISQAQYGVIALVGGDSNVSVAADTSEMALGLHWTAAQGGLIFETRLKLVTDIATARVCAGLSDSIALEQPATIGGSDAVTDVADDYVAFCYDTAADTDEWFALSADSGTPGTGAGATGVAPTAGTYQVLRIEVDASGAQARFYIDGVLVKTVTAGAITAATPIGPIVTCQSLAADAQTVHVDYVMVDSKR